MMNLEKIVALEKRRAQLSAKTSTVILLSGMLQEYVNLVEEQAVTIKQLEGRLAEFESVKAADKPAKLPYEQDSDPDGAGLPGQAQSDA